MSNGFSFPWPLRFCMPLAISSEIKGSMLGPMAVVMISACAIASTTASGFCALLMPETLWT